MTEKNKPAESLLKFPCDFTIKIFGEASDEFDAAVIAIIHKHIPSKKCDIQIRQSEQKKYRSLSVTIHVDSKEQLDKIYQDLSASPLIVMAL